MNVIQCLFFNPSSLCWPSVLGCSSTPTPYSTLDTPPAIFLGDWAPGWESVSSFLVEAVKVSLLKHRDHYDPNELLPFPLDNRGGICLGEEGPESPPALAA